MSVVSKKSRSEGGTNLEYKKALEILKKREKQVHEPNVKEALQLAIELLEKEVNKPTLQDMFDSMW